MNMKYPRPIRSKPEDPLASLGLLAAFSEYSTFVAAFFLVFSFCTGGEFAERVMSIVGACLSAVDYMEPLSFIFPAIVLIFLCGFALSLYHPFSMRTAYRYEVQVMMLFASAVTMWASYMVYQSVGDLTGIQDIGALTRLVVAFLYFGISVYTFFYTLNLEKFDHRALWKDNQFTRKVAVGLGCVLAGIGWWGILSEWREYHTYQIMLTGAILVITTIKHVHTRSSRS